MTLLIDLLFPAQGSDCKVRSGMLPQNGLMIIEPMKPHIPLNKPGPLPSLVADYLCDGRSGRSVDLGGRTCFCPNRRSRPIHTDKSSSREVLGSSLTRGRFDFSVLCCSYSSNPLNLFTLNQYNEKMR